MNELRRDLSTELSIDECREEVITFYDSNSGKAISLPIMKNTYKCIVNNNVLPVLDLISIVKGFYEKTNKKSISIMVSVGERVIEKSISATAHGALFNCTQNEIDNMISFPMVREEIDKLVIESIPQSDRPPPHKQKKMAKKISRVLRVDLGEEILYSTSKLSKFISDHNDYYEAIKSEVDVIPYVHNLLVKAMNKYCMGDITWRQNFNRSFSIYVLLSENEQIIIVKGLIDEFGEKYWIECQECFLSQIVSVVFNKLIINTNEYVDYSVQFERLVDLREN